MPEGSDAEGILLQNLLDAGCDEALVQQCMTLAAAAQWADMLRLLASHKRRLLDAVHGSQKKIDCLDYLVYRIDKIEMQEEST